MAHPPAAQHIEALLPQTQCGECGYDGCRPYAEAMVNEDVPINRCRPGGMRVVKRLAEALGKPVIRPARLPEPPLHAFIDEAQCIGCTLCIKACPTECIIGAPKQAHTVIPERCTGCRLCLEPCPVDCISIVPNKPILKQIENLSPEELENWQKNRAKTVGHWWEERQTKRGTLARSTQKNKTSDPLEKLPAHLREKISTARAQALQRAKEKMHQ